MRCKSRVSEMQVKSGVNQVQIRCESGVNQGAEARQPGVSRHWRKFRSQPRALLPGQASEQGLQTAQARSLTRRRRRQQLQQLQQLQGHIHPPPLIKH